MTPDEDYWEAVLREGPPEDHAMFRRAEQSPPTCSVCGERPATPIAYGFPGTDLVEAHERGEVVIGGCIPDGDAWAPCLACRQAQLTQDERQALPRRATWREAPPY